MQGKWIWNAIAALGLALAGWGAWWWQSRPPQAQAGAAGAALGANAGQGAGLAKAAKVPNAAKGARLPQAELVTVQGRSLQQTVQAVGSVRARRSVVLRSEVPGRVAAIGFADAARVRRGQLLVQLDDALQRADLAQAQAQLQVVQSQFARTRELVAAGFLSRQAQDSGAASVQVAQAQLAQAQARLERMALRAPFDAQTGLRLVAEGDFVKDGVDLVPLEALGARVVDFKLPERLGPALRVGQAVQVQLDAQPERLWRARIEAIEPLLDANARALSVRAALIDADAAALRSGQFARLSVQVGADVRALTLPEEAIVPLGDQSYVVVAEPAPAGAAAPWQSKRLAVRLGVRRDGWVQIVQGLRGDERVVLAGHQRLLKDGTAFGQTSAASDRAAQR